MARRCLTIDLGPLRPDEARVLASGVIEASSRFTTECIERAEGNPLFLEQLLRNAEESGSGSDSTHHPEPGAGAHGPPGARGTSSRCRPHR